MKEPVKTPLSNSRALLVIGKSTDDVVVKNDFKTPSIAMKTDSVDKEISRGFIIIGAKNNSLLTGTALGLDDRYLAQ